MIQVSSDNLPDSVKDNFLNGCFTFADMRFILDFWVRNVHDPDPETILDFLVFQNGVIYASLSVSEPTQKMQDKFAQFYSDWFSD